MIVQVWSLKRGVINPPEPLEDSARVEGLWWAQDHPEKPLSRWMEREMFPPIASRNR